MNVGDSLTEMINTANQSNYMENLMSKYVEVLQKDIETNEGEQNRLVAEINEIRELMRHLEDLSESPEWPNSFIQVNSLAYIPVTIIHTGEHYVKLGPETYTLMSLKETLGFLQRKIDCTQKILDSFKTQRQQLEERCKFSAETSEMGADTKDMAFEIASDKGIAHKTSAGFYEIIEPYVAQEEQAFYKRRQAHKLRKTKSTKKFTQDSDTYFKRLDELQKQEDLRKELGVVTENYKNTLDAAAKRATEDYANISERVRTILRSCGIYRHLLEDDLIQQYCYENITETGNQTSTVLNKSVLDELIVRTLINEPIGYLTNNEVNEHFEIYSEKRDECESRISSNDLAAVAFLDSIENDMQNWKI